MICILENHDDAEAFAAHQWQNINIKNGWLVNSMVDGFNLYQKFKYKYVYASFQIIVEFYRLFEYLIAHASDLF